VYGVLPPAKAVGRMAARRVAESAAASLGAVSGQPAPPRASPDGVGLVGELANEIATQ
jgi:hypothetical protein